MFYTNEFSDYGDDWDYPDNWLDEPDEDFDDEDQESWIPEDAAMEYAWGDC